MNFVEIIDHKKKYLPLLLLADEQESMIDRYLDRGKIWALEDQGMKAICVVTDEGGGVLEMKNLAVEPRFQKRGYGRKLVEFIVQNYAASYSTLLVGTGDSPFTIPFYEKCGFRRSHVIKNFFVDHYDHAIFEGGKQLVDMIYLKRNL